MTATAADLWYKDQLIVDGTISTDIIWLLTAVADCDRDLYPMYILAYQRSLGFYFSLLLYRETAMITQQIK